MFYHASLSAANFMAEVYGGRRIYEAGKSLNRNILDGWEERQDLLPLASQSKTTDELLLLRSNSNALIADLRHIILTKNSPPSGVEKHA